jgi:hypothetical protein
MTDIEKKEKRDRVIDLFESEMVKMTQVEMPVRHIFTPGLYAREITMKAGTVLTSKIHKTEHPFVISKGKVLVYDATVVELKAPYTGITKPNTRRLIKILEDTIWTTFHVTDKTTVEEIEEDIILNRENPLIILDEQNKMKIKGVN